MLHAGTNPGWTSGRRPAGPAAWENRQSVRTGRRRPVWLATVGRAGPTVPVSVEGYTPLENLVRLAALLWLDDADGRAPEPERVINERLSVGRARRCSAEVARTQAVCSNRWVRQIGQHTGSSTSGRMNSPSQAAHSYWLNSSTASSSIGTPPAVGTAVSYVGVVPAGSYNSALTRSRR